MSATIENIWYIQINGKKEGPFSIQELKKHPSLTPDVLVWRKGFHLWIPARNVPELQELFKDEPADIPEDKEEENEKKLFTRKKQGEELVLDMRLDPPQFYFWLLILALIMIYMFYQLFWGH
jgi:hypothetical protein